MLRLCLGLSLLSLAPIAMVTLFAAPPATPVPASKPLPTAESAKAIVVPPGFTATLFAGEPDIVQPIAFTFDDRGRCWVVESHSYPKWVSTPEGRDRIVILEDTDGDGKFDKRTIFLNNGANISGIEIGFGGVWLAATPNLLFVPFRDGEDKPSGPARVVLDGWDIKARHNVFCGLRWGPDGYLYGCNGILSKSLVGKPGTPREKRVPIDCGVWRLHPVSHQFEAVGHGTTNPWGLDFNDFGEIFITNCVINHLWHVVPGTHMERMFGADANPNSYSLTTSVADYLHWGGGSWTESRGGKGAHSDAGGGHAHSGAAIWLGGQWPKEYRGKLFTCNIHGNRLNQDELLRTPSGYKAARAKDFLFANDEWFRGVAVHQGPDNSLYVADWCDTGECHNYEVADTTNGRLYKVVYGKPQPIPGDLAKLKDARLVELQDSDNEWLVRHARRLLQERAIDGKLDGATAMALRTRFDEQTDSTRKLRYLWCIAAVGDFDEPLRTAMLKNADENVRVWAMRLATDRTVGESLVSQLTAMASTETSAWVRVNLASVAQRIAVKQRVPLVAQLLRTTPPDLDANAVRMLWYATEPMISTETVPMASSLLEVCRVPLLRVYLVRRISTLSGGRQADRIAQVLAVLSKVDDDTKYDIIQGVRQALEGQRSAPAPANWKATRAILDGSSNRIKEAAEPLAAVFGDADVLDRMKAAVLDPAADVGTRQRSLDSLVYRQHPGTFAMLSTLLDDPAMRPKAIRALSGFNEATIPDLILTRLPKLNESEKADAVAVLSSRPAWASKLLDTVAAGTLKREDIPLTSARAIQNLKNETVSAKLKIVWGEIRPVQGRMNDLKISYRAELQSKAMATADRVKGRDLYAKNCAACHKLFDEGGNVGPDLTGAQRSNLDYILENVLDPSAVVAREFQMVIFRMDSGRTISGIVRSETAKAVTVQTEKETVLLPVSEIEDRQVTKLSIMPEGIFEKMSMPEVRDLVAYLQGSPLAKK